MAGGVPFLPLRPGHKAKERAQMDNRERVLSKDGRGRGENGERKVKIIQV